MTITFVGPGTAASAAAATIDVPYYVGASAGDKMLMPIWAKRSNHTYPDLTAAGWSLLFTPFAAGAGADGSADQGKVLLGVYERTATGSESGNITVTLTGGTADVMVGRMAVYHSTVGWDTTVAITKALDTGGTTAVSWAFASDIGLTTADWCTFIGCLNTDAYTISAQALTGAGITASYSSRFNTAIATGSQLRYILGDNIISAGPSSGNQTFSLTASGSAANAPAGPGALIRLRELTSTPVVSPHIFRPSFSGGIL